MLCVPLKWKAISPLLVLRHSSSHLPAVLLDPAHNKGLNIGHPPHPPNRDIQVNFAGQEMNSI